MSKLGFLVRFEAKPEGAEAVGQLLRDAVELARAEEGTVSWYSFQESPTVFGVFDTFDDEEGRDAHLNGRIADAIREIAPTLLAAPPEIKRTTILAIK
ncbi:antibiotic biosynthesis monooxygenase [Kitasatospora acidiphila]|uniref:Antibiotic biosynthesis monooxygenase n=1 Tax=Kitasatospora acidiphila TaxID=2567942 RepID=A0A540WD19_9ACTN|nr:putative quinol monooxygenase [Kitasatospora acidiphila]TQF06868.1 antibiotic biosynthesis monooxygenase [Kitasatospora acidiphila]